MSTAALSARVAEQARTAELGRLIGTMLLAVFYALGWIVGKSVVLAWTGLTFAGAAVKVGFVEATQPAARRLAAP